MLRHGTSGWVSVWTNDANSVPDTAMPHDDRRASVPRPSSELRVERAHFLHLVSRLCPSRGHRSYYSINVVNHCEGVNWAAFHMGRTRNIASPSYRQLGGALVACLRLAKMSVCKEWRFQAEGLGQGCPRRREPNSEPGLAASIYKRRFASWNNSTMALSFHADSRKVPRRTL